MAVSLDGFVARRDHRIDWLTKQETKDEDLGYEAFIENIDGLVMGRGSYENVLTFGDWPYTKPVVVTSKTLEESSLPAELKDKVQLQSWIHRS
jgi:dihydrofolate reductase|tara:strand:- start:396 stop:674 length:279 start_codon:yes stop_codon:yes gene_type:complete